MAPKESIYCPKCGKHLPYESCPDHDYDHTPCLNCGSSAGSGFVVRCRDCKWWWNGEYTDDCTRKPEDGDDGVDADWVDAKTDLENSRPQIMGSAYEFLKSKNISGHLLYEKKMATLLTEFAVQEIAEFIGIAEE